MLRLFVALRPPPTIRGRLDALMEGVPGARWQSDEQLHLTLRFIGEVERPLAEDVAAALEQVRARAPILTLNGAGRFGRDRRGGALWAGVTPHDAVAFLHRKVDQACVRAGLAPERRAFLPHVTLARLPRTVDEPAIDRWMIAHAALASEPFVCTHLILYRSHLGGEGASYEPVARWPLEPPVRGAGSQA